MTAQVFLYPPAFSFVELPDPAVARRERHVWVIRNARLAPTYSAVERRALSITARGESHPGG